MRCKGANRRNVQARIVTLLKSRRAAVVQDGRLSGGGRVIYSGHQTQLDQCIAHEEAKTQVKEAAAKKRAATEAARAGVRDGAAAAWSAGRQARSLLLCLCNVVMLSVVVSDRAVRMLRMPLISRGGGGGGGPDVISSISALGRMMTEHAASNQVLLQALLASTLSSQKETRDMFMRSVGAGMLAVAPSLPTSARAVHSPLPRVPSPVVCDGDAPARAVRAEVISAVVVSATQAGTTGDAVAGARPARKRTLAVALRD